MCAQLGRKLLPVDGLSQDKEMGQNGIQSSQAMGSLRLAGPHLHWEQWLLSDFGGQLETGM